MLATVEPSQRYPSKAWQIVSLSLMLSAFPIAALAADAAALYWRLDVLVAQGRRTDAQRLAQANRTVAVKVWANLVFDGLEDNLTQDPAPLSPHAAAVRQLLSEALPNDCPQALTDAVDAPTVGQKPLLSLQNPVAEAVQQFLTAHRSPPNEQIARWREVVQKCAALDVDLGLAISLHRLAWAERTTGSLTLAHAYARQAYTLLEGWHHFAKLPRFLNTLGVIAIQQGDYREAEQFLLDGLKQAEALSNRRWQIACLNNLSILYTRIRNYEAALRAAMQALALVSDQETPAVKARVLNNLGNLYRRLGDFEQALHYLRQALALAQNVGDRALQAETLYLLGMALRDKGDTEDALKTLQEVLHIRKELGDLLGQLELLNDIGDTLAKQGRLHEARERFETALRLAEEADHNISKAWTLFNLGAVYDELGDYQRSLKFSRKALALWQQIGDLWFTSWCWKNIGDAYKHLAERAADDQRSQYRSQALDAYLRSVQLIERIHRRSGAWTLRAEFLQTAIEPFHRLIDLLTRVGRHEDALEFSERMRAQMLLSALQNTPPPTETLLTESERTTYRQLQQRIAALEAQIIAETGRQERGSERLRALQKALESARAEADRLRDLAQLRRIGLAPAAKGVYPPVLPVLAQRLPSDYAALAWVVTKERTWAFVVTRNAKGVQVIAHPIPINADILSEDVLWLRDSLLQRRPVAVTLHRLYTLLIAPLEPYLRGKRRLIIVPDGILFALPFQALTDAQGTYMAERWVISYAPSLRWLTFPLPAPTHYAIRWTGLGIAQWRSPLSPLPFARREVTAIAKAMRAGKATVRVLLDAEATKAQALEALQTSRWVHFATHAILEPERAFYSRLLLAPSDSDNALRAYEVLQMGRVAAEMVVLSACDTGQGRVVRGEGLLGLAWAFLAAGVRTLVVSQWQVNDASTAFLMVNFYRNLSAGMRASDALRRAQLTALRDPAFAHPFYWAPFIVLGQL
ncbi:Photosystem I assembly protein Ycf3 [bacterium HR17]|uniref:Photosystem I assembly protein Ycf3 n=1 Tax=Candidatus Fervidibacter japonicus TaxID=2035412 RepID=A0A2H5XGE2_9BACT|nr:Photosystem I assembly protein Ycf3 [bacterium HR17]